MATVTGLTAERMLEIEAESIVHGAVDLSGHLILTTHGGDTIDAGNVKGEDATALLTVEDTSTVDLTLTGSGTPGDPWVFKGDAMPQPAGVIQAYAGGTIPTGWLLCDGTLVSRTTYAALFAAIGTTY